MVLSAYICVIYFARALGFPKGGMVYTKGTHFGFTLQSPSWPSHGRFTIVFTLDKKLLWSISLPTTNDQDFLSSYQGWISQACKWDKWMKSIISVWIHMKLLWVPVFTNASTQSTVERTGQLQCRMGMVDGRKTKSFYKISSRNIDWKQTHFAGCWNESYKQIQN